MRKTLFIRCSRAIAEGAPAAAIKTNTDRHLRHCEPGADQKISRWTKNSVRQAKVKSWCETELERTLQRGREIRPETKSLCYTRTPRIEDRAWLKSRRPDRKWRSGRGNRSRSWARGQNHRETTKSRESAPAQEQTPAAMRNRNLGSRSYALSRQPDDMKIPRWENRT
jgi:hypothetical protein